MYRSVKDLYLGDSISPEVIDSIPFDGEVASVEPSSSSSDDSTWSSIPLSEEKIGRKVRGVGLSPCVDQVHLSASSKMMSQLMTTLRLTGSRHLYAFEPI